MSLFEEHRPEEMIIICGAFTTGRAQFFKHSAWILSVKPHDGSATSVTSFRKWKIGDPEAWHSRDPRQPGSRTCAPILSESPALIR